MSVATFKSFALENIIGIHAATVLTYSGNDSRTECSVFAIAGTKFRVSAHFILQVYLTIRITNMHVVRV
jgi:hypothetical protein